MGCVRVKNLSKFSAALPHTLGLKGGWISLLANRSQSILRKKACSFISRSPSGLQPRRLDGCFVISPLQMDTASLDMDLG